MNEIYYICHYAFSCLLQEGGARGTSLGCKKVNLRHGQMANLGGKPALRQGREVLDEARAQLRSSLQRTGMALRSC